MGHHHPALVGIGSAMGKVIYEEFKGIGAAEDMDPAQTPARHG
jgi:transcription termination factor Rho